MKNQLIVIAALAVFAVGGFVYYKNSVNPKHVEMMASDVGYVMETEVMMEKKGEEMMKPEVIMEEKVMNKSAEVMIEKTMTEEKEMMKSEVKPVAPIPTPTTTIAPAMMMKEKGSYVPFDSALLAKAQNGKVVLFFRASWCPMCKGLDANIRANVGEIPEGVTILDVDYDNSAEMKKKYGVTYQHTMVQVDVDGTLIKKWSGSPTLAVLVSEIK